MISYRVLQLMAKNALLRELIYVNQMRSPIGRMQDLNLEQRQLPHRFPTKEAKHVWTPVEGEENLLARNKQMETRGPDSKSTWTTASSGMSTRGKPGGWFALRTVQASFKSIGMTPTCISCPCDRCRRDTPIHTHHHVKVPVS